MTVKELRPVLFGPADALTVEVCYNGECYDIALESPAQAAFDKYIVEYVSAPKPFSYSIGLKQKYLMDGDE